MKSRPCFLPDGTLYTNAGIEPLRGPDFESEALRAPYLSRVVPLPGTSSVKSVYQAVPVKNGSRTIAVLYSYTELLTTFAGRVRSTAYDGKAQISVADAEDGAFLLDTRHGSLGNIDDPSLLSRPVKPGFDYETAKADYREGRSGCIAFFPAPLARASMRATCRRASADGCCSSPSPRKSCLPMRFACARCF